MIPGVGHPDRPHFDVVAEVLRTQIERAMSAAGINGSVDVNTRVVHTSRFGVPASINVEVVTAEANIPAAQAIIEADGQGLGTNSMTEEDLAFAKKKLRTQWYRTLRNPDQLAFQIGHFQTMDRWQTLVPYMEARETTTVEDLRRLAAKYFVPDNRAWGNVRPKTGGRSISEDDR